MRTLTNYIDGRHLPPANGAYLDVTEPATSGLLARVPDSGRDDINAAVVAASAAFPMWSTRTPAERSEVLLRIADGIDARLDELAVAESRDTGKPISLARTVDIPRAAANFRYFATAILHTESAMHDMGRDCFNYTLRKPRGVAGLISPWNLPLYLLTWKIAPAIATGNTCVCKPSEVTPLTAFLLCDIMAQAGLPPGVVNIVHGLGASTGGVLVTHPDVPTISFTGSTKVGQWIAEHAGRMLKRVSLELGGKNPYIVFDDAPIELTLDNAVRAAFSNQGQICLCGSRFLIQESIAVRFVESFVERARSLRVGDPMEATTQHGAQTSREQLAKIESYVQAAREQGGEILCGGAPVAPDQLPPRCKDGLFFEPTVIRGLPNDCRVVQEEIFGPVVTIQTFRDEQEAVSLANSTPYGLAASIWTNDLNRAHRMGARVDSGIIWINCWMVRDLRTPFGGMKQSGVGREGGNEALRFFTEPKNICVRMV
ncbi:MAG: aldehyde dehydrogenase [Phycisphaeraceae bacterium]|nr:aldehyde dehydrogenase [Phycisphaerales bacterium]MCB9843445.1 aldehyde dehydrogenase [Phycisphaeraceae bacterium]